VVVELSGGEADLDGDKNISPTEQMKYNDELTQGRMFVPYQPFKHPQYGDIEIGGFKHDTNRTAERFMQVEENHRNAMHAIFYGYHMPKLSVQTPEVIKVKDGLYRVHVPVKNERVMPSVAGVVRQNKLHRDDLATITGGKVIAAGVVTDPYMNRVQMQEHRPERLMVSGIGSMEVKTLMFLVEARPGNVTFQYDSVKAGKLSATITLP
jgi:hypothetical protein